ncbi:transcriptional regulator [Kocuria rosea subsp. polaris]|uniref:Transcriptional regulator n=1 Tax=Kocuria rosea subsp. polaris TaxID=136273 RepID=A0A0W8INN3_KOCRO|nr:MerR family transcriptional regulator [Kocuria polaris]KUG61783.1 transcriptional regulator [Kocuria polaris]
MDGQRAATAGGRLTVGQVARRFGVTVRTLHHYDDVGLLRPGERSAGGYRLYTEDDLLRLQHVVVYRRLGFSLGHIEELLVDGELGSVRAHLRRQRETVLARQAELAELVTAIDRALEKDMTGIDLTPEERRELFGDGFSDEHAAEAERRWGDTDAWQQSRRRTAGYDKEDWQRIAAGTAAINERFVQARRAGLPADSAEAMDAAEAARRQIHERFYDLPPELHRALGDMYVADPRFTRTYEDLEPGLAQYVRDAIHANADRAAG